MSIERLLELTSPEVKAAIEQICDEAGTWDASWQVLKVAGELLAAAKAASVVPVKIVGLSHTDWGLALNVRCRSEDDSNVLWRWLRDRMKDTPPQA